MLQVSPTVMVSFYSPIYPESSNTCQSVVYLSKGMRHRLMSLQVDSICNELSHTTPSDIYTRVYIYIYILPTEYAMQYKQRKLQSALFQLFTQSHLIASLRISPSYRTKHKRDNNTRDRYNKSSILSCCKTFVSRYISLADKYFQRIHKYSHD
jgi:hypothetical protein